MKTQDARTIARTRNRLGAMTRVFGRDALPTKAARGRLLRAIGADPAEGYPMDPVETVAWYRQGDRPGFLNRAHRRAGGTVGPGRFSTSASGTEPA